MPSPTESNDPIKPWFRAVESMDEFIGIRFGHMAPGANKVEWMFLPHTEFDGIGGLAHLLRERGADVGDLPKIPHPAALSWLSFLRALPGMLAPRHRLAWKSLKQGPKLDKVKQPPPAVAVHVFSEEDTAKIRWAARNADVSVNSLLLRHLDRAVRPYLQDPSSATPWMVPVNLRGRVKQPTDVENHSSYIAIRIMASDGAKAVHRRIYNELQKGRHCANWKSYSTGRLCSDAMKRFLIRTDRAISQWNIGGLSNLGIWDWDKSITDPRCLGDWFFSPPVLRSQHLGAGCVTFQGRLTLTLQAHPDLTTSPEVTEAWVRHWVREIELDFPVTSPADFGPSRSAV
jgi:hypothetical protein